MTAFLISGSGYWHVSIMSSSISVEVAVFYVVKHFCGCSYCVVETFPVDAKRFGRVVHVGRGASAALQAGGVEGLSDYLANPHGYPMSKVEPMMSRIDSANDKISMSRIENKPAGIGGF